MAFEIACLPPPIRCSSSRLSSEPNRGRRALQSRRAVLPIPLLQCSLAGCCWIFRATSLICCSITKCAFAGAEVHQVSALARNFSAPRPPPSSPDLDPLDAVVRMTGAGSGGGDGFALHLRSGPPADILLRDLLAHSLFHRLRSGPVSSRPSSRSSARFASSGRNIFPRHHEPFPPRGCHFHHRRHLRFEESSFASPRRCRAAPRFQSSDA